MQTLTISEIQGRGVKSAFEGKQVITRGVVTVKTREGFVMQGLSDGDDLTSDALFVTSRKQPRVGTLVRVTGVVVELQEVETDAVTTQIDADDVDSQRMVKLPPVRWIEPEELRNNVEEMATFLRTLEGMRVGIRKGATFVAPSNSYGDYVVTLAGQDVAFTAHGGVRTEDHHYDVISFRVHPRRRTESPLVNVGSTLESDVIGVMLYRAGAFQIETHLIPKVMVRHHTFPKPTLKADAEHLSVMTLNAFNLDPKVEARHRVLEKRDIDDDKGDGRYRKLAEDIRHCGYPDIIAAQEFQDDDGAEISDQRSAEKNMNTLIRELKRVGGPDYVGVDRQPGSEEGGQPNAHIRNVFFYRRGRVRCLEHFSIAENHPAFVDTRLPHVAKFSLVGGGDVLTVVNVHLSSKRGTFSGLHHQTPSMDPRLPLRVQQAEELRAYAQEALKSKERVYVTGDFNDTEASETLKAACGETFENLVLSVDERERYDYNHRGGLQSLTHAVVAKADGPDTDFEIVHANEILGVKPGSDKDAASDHAYVLMKMKVQH